MPFPDELARPWRVVEYRPEWAQEFSDLAETIRIALAVAPPSRDAITIDHIGSTSVPGLAAKDCIDVQIRVPSSDTDEVAERLVGLGLRRRPESWNTVDETDGRRWPKAVFGSGPGQRVSNVHVRPADSPAVRRNLLFRDYLRADTAARDAWGGFKKALADGTDDFWVYGAVKQPATTVLMIAAEAWARSTQWQP